MTEMIPRERVYSALNHKEPDRVPISFGGTLATTMTECPPEKCTCTELYKYLKLKDYDMPAIGPVGNIVGNLDEQVMQLMGSDLRGIYPNAPDNTFIAEDGYTIYPFQYGMRIKKVGWYDEWDFINPPMKNLTTVEDIDNYPYWPDTSINIMEGVVEKAKELNEKGYFLVGDALLTYFPVNGYGFVSGLEKWLSDMKIRPKFYHELAGRFLETTKSFLTQFYSQVSQYLDGAVIYDDLGTQEAGLMSLSDYREFYKPYQIEIIKTIRKYLRPEAKIFIHSCGSVYQFIPDLIEIGVQVLNPVQPLAADMEPRHLKKEFGNDIAFMGGFDVQYLLPLGTKEEIREGVKKLIQTYAPGGGFIFANSINVPPETPPENIVAAFEAVEEFGKYPITELEGESYIEYIRGLDLGDRK